MVPSVNISDVLGHGNVDSELTFTVPKQFVRIDLDESPDTRIPRTFTRLETVGKISDERKFQLIYAQELTIEKLRTENALYCGLCLSLNENVNTVSTAQFTVVVKNIDLSGENSLAYVANSLKSGKGHREIMLCQLPTGDALAIGEETLVQSPQFQADSSETTSIRTRQAQIIIPLPNKKKAAFFSVTSDNLSEWHHYTNLLNSIVHTVTFGNATKSSISAKLDSEN